MNHLMPPRSARDWGSMPVLWLALLLSGCGGMMDAEGPEPPTPTPAPSVTWYRDVAPILQQRCVSCHRAGSIAPFPLDTWEDTRAVAASVEASVVDRRMPPWGVDNSGRCNTFQDARWLSDAEIATISAWVKGGTPAGDPVDAPPPYVEDPGLDRVSATLDMGVDYTPTAGATDDYRCFVLDPGLEADGYITAYQVRPGNAGVVHHVVVYDVLSEDGVAAVERLDEEDPGPGYACYGGPGVGAFNLYAAWAPGTGATRFPADTGLLLPAGRKVVLQVHYNVAAGGGPDRTVVDLELDDRVSSPALMALIPDIDLALPAGRTKVDTLVDISSSDLGAPVDVTVYGVFPHMHQLGASLRVDHVGKTQNSCVVDVPRWDFDWQGMYFFDQPLAFHPDELVRLSCSFDTTGQDRITLWGESTRDEMCVAIFYATLGVTDDAVDPATTGEAVPGFSGVDAVSAPVSHEWSLMIGGRGTEGVRDVAVDGAGNTWVVGYSQESDSVNFGAGRVTAPGGGDGFVAKYDPDGALIWAKLLGGSDQDTFNGVGFDADGNAVIAGYTRSIDLVLGETTLVSAGQGDMLVAKLDPDGEVLWARLYGGEGNDFPRQVAVGPDGNIAVAGYFGSSIDFGATHLEAGGESVNGVLASLDGQGSPRWARGCIGSSTCQYRAVAVDPEGRVVASGYFYETADFGAGPVTSVGWLDGFIASHAAEDGAVIWEQHFGDADSDYFRAVAVDPEGEVYAAGRFAGTVTIDGHPLTFVGSGDTMVVKLSRDGEWRWGRSFGGIAGDEGTDVVPTADGGVLVSGYYEATLDQGGGEITNAGKSDVLISRYAAADGSYEGSQHIGGRESGYSSYMGLSGQALSIAWIEYGDIDAGGGTLSHVGGADVVVAQYGW